MAALISDIPAYIDYFEGIRKRTLNFLNCVPAERVDFSPHPGKFTFGDLIRHLASTEAMFVRAVVEGRWAYEGHGPELGGTLGEALEYLRRRHGGAIAQLRDAPPEVLTVRRPTLQGPPTSGWRLLMAMAEHEIHHRSQVSQYLVALGFEPPQIFGLRIEQTERP